MKRLLLLILFALPAQAQIIFPAVVPPAAAVDDTIAVGTYKDTLFAYPTASTVTVSHTVASGSSRGLIVVLSTKYLGSNPSSVNWEVGAGSQSMTLEGSEWGGPSDFWGLAIYSLASPDVGTGNIEINGAGSSAIIAGILPFTGVKSGDFASVYTEETAPADWLMTADPTVSGDHVMMVITSSEAATSPQSGTTSLTSGMDSGSSYFGSVARKKATGATTELGYTGFTGSAYQALIVIEDN